MMNLQILICTPNRKTIQLNSGFTLIELIITITVFAVVVSISTPKLQTLVSNNRIISQINNFNGSISFARSEAIKHGQLVLMVPVKISNWANGWNIVLPGNGNQLLSHVDAFSGKTILASNSGVPNIQFTDEGRIITLSNIEFSLCNTNTTPQQNTKGKLLTVTPTGVTILDSNYVCP